MKFHQYSFLIALLLAATVAPVTAAPDEAAALAVLASDAGVEQKANACDDLGVVGTAKAVPALAELLSDNKLNDYARDALERIEDPAAGQALRDSLKTLKGDLRVGVILSLGDRGEEAAVPALQKIAAGKNAVAADAALSSLGQIATDEAVATILSVLENGNADGKLSAAHAALKAAERNSAKAAKLRNAVAASGVPAHVAKAAGQ